MYRRRGFLLEIATHGRNGPLPTVESRVVCRCIFSSFDIFSESYKMQICVLITISSLANTDRTLSFQERVNCGTTVKRIRHSGTGRRTHIGAGASTSQLGGPPGGDHGHVLRVCPVQSARTTLRAPPCRPLSLQFAGAASGQVPAPLPLDRRKCDHEAVRFVFSLEVPRPRLLDHSGTVALHVKFHPVQGLRGPRGVRLKGLMAVMRAGGIGRFVCSVRAGQVATSRFLWICINPICSCIFRSSLRT